MITISTLAKPCEDANMTTHTNAEHKIVIAKYMDGIDQRGIAHVGFSLRGRRALRGGPRGRRGLHAFASGHISCNCVLNVDQFSWYCSPSSPSSPWRARAFARMMADSHAVFHICRCHFFKHQTCGGRAATLLQRIEPRVASTPTGSLLRSGVPI